MKNSMPTVEYKGKIYKLNSRKTEVPDLATMNSIAALVWINQNTVAKGRRKTENLLAGMDVLTINVK
jgi:hypothetical protein